MSGPRTGRRSAAMPFRDVALDALLEERDHLKIRLNLLEDPDIATFGSTADVSARLVEIERRIAAHRRRPAADDAD
jgi:hypothetical protein